MLGISFAARDPEYASLSLANKVVLHPNVIARVGGEPAMLLPATQTDATAGLLACEADLRDSLHARRTHLCAALEGHYHDLAAVGFGRQIIQLRAFFDHSGSYPHELK